jgi:two-component system response regulator AtoC
MSTILIIEDDKDLCRVLELQLQLENYQTNVAFNATDGLKHVKNQQPDIVLLDLNLPDESGLKILPLLLAAGPSVVIMTGDSSNKLVVEAMRLGAFDYLRKPLDLHNFFLVLKKVQRHRRALEKNTNGDDRSEAGRSRWEIIGAHQRIIETHKNIGLLSRSRVTVLILGESGTGKELVAHVLHEASAPGQPFVAIDCLAVVPTLLESEFFGHEKGAFTGADSRKIGKLEHAASGTVFLDEIGDMAPDLQSKLLRVLQEEEFTRVGGLDPIPLKARCIAATHVDLEEKVRAGKFREDLLYRLRVATLNMPPLREIKSDIPILIDFLMTKISIKLHQPVLNIEQAALDTLMAYDWPGNVRQLENVLTRAIAIAKGSVLELQDLEAIMPQRHLFEPDDACKRLEDVEKAHITKILLNQKWNITQSARTLNISPTTLRKKINDYGIREAGADKIISLRKRTF